MDHAKTKYSKLSLDVFELNKKAINFYKREGFEIIDRHLNRDTGKTEYTMIYKS